MQVDCPRCGHQVLEEDIDLAARSVFCKRCALHSDLSAERRSLQTVSVAPLHRAPARPGGLQWDEHAVGRTMSITARAPARRKIGVVWLISILVLVRVSPALLDDARGGLSFFLKLAAAVVVNAMGFVAFFLRPLRLRFDHETFGYSCVPFARQLPRSEIAAFDVEVRPSRTSLKKNKEGAARLVLLLRDGSTETIPLDFVTYDNADFARRRLTELLDLSAPKVAPFRERQ
jgi:hypothetical protein